MIEIKTERLLLRKWQVQDLQPFAEINQDLRSLTFWEAL
jgi:RimJ/RimL family protein N-acetyltransferase